MKTLWVQSAAALLLSLALDAFATTRYVDLNSTNATPPYTNWTTASTNIQVAVDAAAAGDEIWVTNGFYDVGGALLDGPNRVAVKKPLTVQSINGPEVTVISGRGVWRCAYLTNGALLAGFTLTNGTAQNGGGISCQSASVVVSNCILVGNYATSSGGGAIGGMLRNCTLTNNQTDLTGSGGGAAGSALENCTVTHNSADSGGGAFGGTLTNCLITGNSGAHAGGGTESSTLVGCILSGNYSTLGDGGGAVAGTLYNCSISNNTATGVLGHGGGASSATLFNCLVSSNAAFAGGGGAYDCLLVSCTVVSNRAAGGTSYGGGALASRARNSILYDNQCKNGANYYGGSLVYCCTIPQPGTGVGNITNAPLFVNPVGGDFHLQPSSPCINAGNNAYVSVATDLDGNPRIVGGIVDMGAYECQSPALLDYYNWLLTYDLSTSASAFYADSDGDGLNNWQEWRCLTDPTNALSVLKLLVPLSGSVSEVTVSWQSVTNRSYWLERATNLASSPTFSSVASNLAGQLGTTSYTDTTATNGGPFFYRVGVQP